MNGSSAESEQTVSSLEFLKVINIHRVNAGMNTLENNKFLKRVEDEIDDLGSTFFRTQKQQGGNGVNKIMYYNLNKRQMLLVGMRESKVVRRKVLDWIEELENKLIPTNFSEALLLAYKQQKVIEDKEEQLQLQAPKVEAYEVISNSERLSTFDECGKLFGLGRNKLYRWMKDNGYIKHNNVPYQKWVDKGLLDYKIDEFNGKQYYVALMTGKGIIYFRKLLNQN